jgi:ferric-dicitrate binding protein FerR (iron transport regulator)
LNRTADASETQGQAAAWLVRLDAENSAATLAQWRQWLSEDARHRAAYLRLESSWRHADCLKNLQPLDGTVNPSVLESFPGLRTFPDKRPPALHPEVVYRTLAAALALVTLILAVWLCIGKPSRGVHRTEPRGFERVVLPCGEPAGRPWRGAIRRVGPEQQFAPH